MAMLGSFGVALPPTKVGKSDCTHHEFVAQHGAQAAHSMRRWQASRSIGAQCGQGGLAALYEALRQALMVDKLLDVYVARAPAASYSLSAAPLAPKDRARDHDHRRASRGARGNAASRSRAFRLPPRPSRCARVPDAYRPPVLSVE